MSKPIDLTGRKFGRWTALNLTKTDKGVLAWVCRCECGTVKVVPMWNLLKGSSHSCGCLARELTVKRNTKHGNANRGNKSSTYNTWNAMKSRCLYPRNKHYSDYGGRGITFCERWEFFENFLVDMGEKPKGMTLERIDNNEGYSPDNCKWATNEEQANNKRNCLMVDYNDERISITQLARKTKLSRYALKRRIFKLGWDVGRAINTPIRERLNCAGK